MNVHRLSLLTVFAAAQVFCANSQAADWPTFLGAGRDGRSPDAGLLKQWPKEGPKLLWKVETVGPGWSSVAVVNGLVFTTGNEGANQMLICLDEKTGKEKWRAVQGPKSSHNKYGGAEVEVDGEKLFILHAAEIIAVVG